MKKLTRVKLINWHRFINDTIEFENSTLISGENGAGKSTLLDAIQFVVTCTTNYFNKAAHENGKRKLTGYIRCKTGRENKPYERTGEISAHVALEFYEEKKDRYFIVGAVVDSASEGQEKTVRYLMDNMRLDDTLFFQGKTPKSINQFRTTNTKVIRQWCTTEKEAKSMMKNRFGRIEDKFFRLIPKALAFRPIDDIKDFVYSYVLDEKEVNIDVLRENVRSYQDLQRTLENVKLRIEKLEQIVSAHTQIVDGQKKDKMYDFFLERVEADLIAEEIAALQREVSSEEYRLKEQNGQIITTKKEQEEKQRIRDDLRTELASDKDFIAKDEQEKRLKELEERQAERLEEKQNLLDSIEKAKRQLKKLLEVKDVADCVKKYSEDLSGIEKKTNLADVRSNLEQVISYKNEMRDKVFKKQADLSIQKEHISQEKQELEQKIERLMKKKLSYADEVSCVIESIREEFVRIGRLPAPRILCEMLEITDETWRNAVEGYLNTQRFYILVEPENFDIALGTYDRLRKEKRAYGVGLINTQKLDEYDVAPEGSLATVVTSKNKYAKRYINMILGKVVMCDNYQDLKKHRTSITRECMKYQNHVASAIKPSIFETPYIGQAAVKVQLDQARQKSLKLKAQLKELDDRIEMLQSVLEPLSTEHDMDIKYRIPVLSDLQWLRMEIHKCKENIATLEKNSGMIMKQVQLSALESLLQELASELDQLNRRAGNTEEHIKNLTQQIAERQVDFSVQKGLYTESGLQAGDYLPSWNQEYEKQTGDKSFLQFKENYGRRKKANLTTVDKLIDNMKDTMVKYKTAHDFGAAAAMEGYSDFEAEYVKLKNSELLQYEEKVESARQSAEEEFREQFLSKLQENMKTAQGEFKELNRELQNIVFSNEKYEFLFMPSKRYRQYYEMIMDDFNAMQGESIFSGIFHETHKAVIDELFERLALDNENSSKALDEFTDYRTYMDYDIRIIHSDGTYSLYSKVCEEKSGGETQTPFYVTVAASFVQLYKNNIGGESIGLVLFDEAFNNMDDERIGGVLEFLRRLPLQILIASPPDKIQYISPFIEETLLVMTDEKTSFVERYVNGAV
ncbi:AAA family ATPase [Lachnospiraceae bacterium MD1]|uniref:AAA family ATPase n=1 Tax=Variimorphobacter saccharofermentans TaxID=2755051 RepID=A0A839K096_9FIRM|nr:SbcC/MukB-like Walker B domain-containing protein [Variimorphobacter saccharofermentans]MBB2182151.1 AAA family ATPase [Variimorphobacter saccharofermentans]